MKKVLLTLSGIAIVLVGGFYLLNSYIYVEKQADTAASGTIKTFSDEELGLAFDYRTGPNGYVLELPELTGTAPDHRATIILMLASDYAELQNGAEGREGPPTISLQIFANRERQRPLAWTSEHASLSGIDMLVEGTENYEYYVGGAPSIRYTIDGLYRTDTAIVTHGENVYIVSGAYLSDDSPIRKDFQPLLDSIRFIPTPVQK